MNTKKLDTIKKQILHHYNFKQNSILDVGSSERLFDEIAQTNSVYILDRKKITNKRITSKQCDLNLLSHKDIPSKKFDVLILFDILEHLVDPEYVFKMLLTHVKKGGKIFISSPNSFNLINRLYCLFGTDKDITDNTHLSNRLFTDHLHKMNYNKINRLLKESGCTIKHCTSFYSPAIENKKLKFLYPLTKCIAFTRLYKLFPGLLTIEFIIEAEK